MVYPLYWHYSNCAYKTKIKLERKTRHCRLFYTFVRTVPTNFFCCSLSCSLQHYFQLKLGGVRPWVSTNHTNILRRRKIEEIKRTIDYINRWIDLHFLPKKQPVIFNFHWQLTGNSKQYEWAKIETGRFCIINEVIHISYNQKKTQSFWHIWENWPKYICISSLDYE